MAYSPKTLAARKRWMSKCSGRLWVEGKPSNLAPERANQVDKGFHFSHHLGCHRGLFYCTACGAYGSQKARKLTSPCGQPQPGTQPKQHWLNAVARIQKGLLPSGLRCWPEEQAPAAESTVVGFQDWLLQRRSKLLTGPAADSHEAPTAAEKKARRQYMKEVTLQSRWSAVMEQDPGRAAAWQATRPAAVSSSLGRQPVEEDDFSAAVQLPVLKVVRKKSVQVPEASSQADGVLGTSGAPLASFLQGEQGRGPGAGSSGGPRFRVAAESEASPRPEQHIPRAMRASRRQIGTGFGRRWRESCLSRRQSMRLADRPRLQRLGRSPVAQHLPPAQT